MTPLETENLDLSLTDRIVHMTVTGTVAPESFDAGLEWIGNVQEQFQEAEKDFAVSVNMAEDDFSGLGQLRQEFNRVGTLLRHSTEASKCAVMTDSQFLRNTARVEGAVIPGLDLRSFDLDEADPAMRWLKGQPLLQTPQNDGPSVSDNDTAEPETGGDWDNLNMKKITL